MIESFVPLAVATELSWATPLAAVGGALLVAILNSRQQRTQHLREKMLDAADAFQMNMETASDAVLRLGRDSTSRADALEWRASAEIALDEARAGLARVNLLFGPDSKTSMWAMEAHLRLDTTVRWHTPDLVDVLDKTSPDRDVTDGDESDEDDEVEAAREELHRLRELADDHMRDFARTAFAAMRSPGRLRRIDQIREPLRLRVWWPIRHPRKAAKRRRMLREREIADENVEP
jgi:hypothetical protein